MTEYSQPARVAIVGAETIADGYQTGEHDELDGGATVLAYAGTTSASTPLTWFARTSAFACLNPSPAFDTEIKLEPGQTLRLNHRLVFLDRMVDRHELEPIAQEFAL
ncbi:hypothetical protein AQJ84_22870 [Streptomyces resistomycificus]|uniref:DUF6807 family protein n=1 Tax=Streptomyces resistomycificus TaxID=67356 RepID=UPI00074339DD|nr:DUF6807 family protein [Streptomyces resistomycificus]KUN95645.1 hypothetical protein AQJ84_22870 [Streptomyces resistomycificus]